MGFFQNISRNRWVMLLRLHRLAPIMLIILPCWWGLALAGSGIADYAIFSAAAIIMRAAGCVCNDIWDRDFDALVARTKNRPLACGRITVRQAVCACLACCALGGIIWLLYLNTAAKLWSLAGLFILIIYPAAKRVTRWPQLVLGLGFNLGIIIAFLQTSPSPVSPGHLPWLLYAWGIGWTLAYDTVYAFQDAADDLQLGIGSLAVRFFHIPKLFIGAVYLLQTLLLWFALRGYCGYDTPQAAFSSVGVAAISYMMLYFWNPHDHAGCQRYFLRHIWIGIAVWLLLV